jgi:hypothetical protein
MRKTEIAAILLLCALLAGCGTAFEVTQREQCKGGKCDGVPFYTKAVACNHETVWLEPTYILTLTGTQKPDTQKPHNQKPDTQKPHTQKLDTQKPDTQKPQSNQPNGQPVVLFNLTKEISQYDLSSDPEFKNELQKFIERVIKQNPEGLDAPAILSAFNGLREYKLPLIDNNHQLQQRSLTLASNRNEIYTFVDYSTPYYFNAKRPFSGSVNPEIDLGSDLTLSKASVNVTEETFKTSMGVLSAAATGMGAAPLTAPAAEAEKKPPLEAEKPPTPVLLQLTIEPRVYQYTLSTLLDSNTGKLSKPPCQYLEPLFDLGHATTFSRMVMPVDQSKKKGDGSNTLKFSGSIDLPKAQPQKQFPKESADGK